MISSLFCHVYSFHIFTEPTLTYIFPPPHDISNQWSDDETHKQVSVPAVKASTAARPSALSQPLNKPPSVTKPPPAVRAPPPVKVTAPPISPRVPPPSAAVVENPEVKTPTVAVLEEVVPVPINVVAAPPKPATASAVVPTPAAKPVVPAAHVAIVATPVRKVEKEENIDQILASLPSAQKAQNSSESTAGLLRANQRIRDLEVEVFELQKKLDRSNSRLSHQVGGSEALSRETELENELALSADRYSKQRNANRSLELTIKELQSRLTHSETEKFMFSTDSSNNSSSEPNRRSREKELEEALIKAKREKDRAVKVLINVLGKKQVAEFLTRHAGAPDILDALCDHFKGIVSENLTSESGNKKNGTGLQISVGADGGTSGGSKATKRKPNNEPKKKAPLLSAGRSRSDEMYASHSLW